MTGPDVRVERVVHTSSSADEAWEVLSQVYMRVEPHADSAEASVELATAVSPGLAVDRAGSVPPGAASTPAPVCSTC
ncbi:hypothetical protein [Klenkia brasiliensis]|uniref:Uncharacterized protein n=1 Tax=Klenkia brasiliensis TaxID=333142 RepID=A0A1G8AAP9_9ACTN|nr:hypothetical protein [Klenkia brasiliensis]SDH18018.1 hypothetical protein SAMN05660324_0084 [Klenkia brasiliensis]